MSRSVSSEFLKSLCAALTFWQYRLESEPISRLDPSRHNLYRAVEFGLNEPVTRTIAARVVISAFSLIYARGYWQEWLPLLEGAQAASEELAAEAQIELLIQLGHVRRLNRRLDEALTAYRDALALAEQSADLLLQAEARVHLGRALRDARQNAEAEKELQIALQFLEDGEGEEVNRLLALAKNVLGLVAYDLGQTAKAKAYLERAVALRRQQEDPPPLSDALHDLGNTYRVAGAYREALAVYEEALALLEGTGFRLDRIRIRFSIGVLHFSRRAYDLAEASFRAIDFPYLRETGNLHFQAMILVSLGNALLYQECYREAAAALRESVSLWRQLQDDLELANAIGSLGEALAGLGETDMAQETFTEALSLLAQYPEEAQAGRLRALFTAELAKVTGQPEP